jgi:transaldolase
MRRNPLLDLTDLGQSVWLDFLSRKLIASGDLLRLIREDGVKGVTSNPSILEEAVAGSDDYDGAIAALTESGKDPASIYTTLAVEDVRQAADLLRPVYDRLEGADGYASLEVSPHLAYDTAATLTQAREFWMALDRPNVMIKVPATRAGLPAICQLTAEGVNVNVTLIFGLTRYREVVESYLDGLVARTAAGKPLERVASVASFFLSRIDALTDGLLSNGPSTRQAPAKLVDAVRGQVAIASAKLAYQIYQEQFESERFGPLRDMGARPQRVLWASTGTKNPAYSDVKYIDALIGPDTINTMPMKTLLAYRDHGKPALRLTQYQEQAHMALKHLATLGIDLDAVTQQLEDEGVRKFIAAYDKLTLAFATRDAVGHLERQRIEDAASGAGR